MIFGPTHQALHRRVGPDGEYLNTGTWMDLTSLDAGSLGTLSERTFVLIECPEEGKPRARLKVRRGQYRVEEDVFG